MSSILKSSTLFVLSLYHRWVISSNTCSSPSNLVCLHNTPQFYSSCGKLKDFIFSYYFKVFHCAYIPQLLYSLIYLWIFEKSLFLRNHIKKVLFLSTGYCVFTEHLELLKAFFKPERSQPGAILATHNDIIKGRSVSKKFPPYKDSCHR